tara:strand:+ start:114 stop:509 length:396 start_codon:yes stop_codon:yes gene_type:complete
MNELSLELTFLLWSVVITFIQLIISLLGATQQHGLATLAGNRENIGSTSGWAGRAQRAHRNMLENLILFAILVIVAHIAGVSNELTVLGAQMFFWGRLAYSLIYVVGVAWLRTVAFLVSILGLILIFLQLI